MKNEQRKKAYERAVKKESEELSEHLRGELDRQDKRVQKPEILTVEQARAEILRWRT